MRRTPQTTREETLIQIRLLLPCGEINVCGVINGKVAANENKRLR